MGELTGGQAYEHATSAFLHSLEPATAAEVVSVTSDSLKLAWQVAIAVSGLGFFLVFLEKDVPLRKKLETDYGIQEKETVGGVDRISETEKGEVKPPTAGDVKT